MFRRALAVDWTALAPVRGLRCAVAVFAVLVLGLAAGQPNLAVLATFGALTAGIVSLTQGARTPYFTMVCAGLVTALSTAVGSLAAHAFPVLLIALSVWGLLAGLLVGAGGAATTVGVQAVIGLVVLGRFPLTLGATAQASAAVLVGAGLQIALCAVLRPPARDKIERLALADLVDLLADWACAPATFLSSRADLALEQTRVLLDRRQRWAAASPLRSVLTNVSRTRLQVGALVAERRRRVELQPDIDRLLAHAVLDLRGLATLLRHPRHAQLQVLGALPPAGADVDHEQLRRDGDSLAGQLRAARNALSSWTRSDPGGSTRLLGARPLTPTVRPREVLAAVRHPAPAALRHATRLAVLLPLAEVLARVLPLQRGYWVALTVVVVLKPDYASSTERGVARLLGTLVGVVPASLLVSELHLGNTGLAVAVGVLAWASYAAFPAGYALYSAALSALVVVLIDISLRTSPDLVAGAGVLGTAGTRAVDTALGGLLALVAYLLWPTWEGSRVSQALGRLIEAQAAYAGHLFLAYAGSPADRADLPDDVRLARACRADLMATLGRVEAEPLRAGGPDTGQARDALAAASRILNSLQVLHSHVDEAGSIADAGELAAWADTLGAALSGAAQQARGDAVATGPGLRTGAAALLLLPDQPSPLRQMLAREVDELVDAVNSLTFVLH